MRRIARSNTIFGQKLEGFPKLQLIINKSKEEHNKDDYINYIIPKKLASDKSNLISIDYISENKLLKKKREQELDLEIENLAKILLSKNKTEEIKNENSLIYLLTQKTKRYTEENKEKLIEIIKHILLKQNKTDEETLIIKTFFMKNEKLASLILPSHIINSENLVSKLSSQLKFEEYKSNSIICKEGDKGEKLYIVLKGESAVVVQKEGKGGECTQFEYIKYLIVLYLYQEMSMISRILFYNKDVMKIEERCVLTLFIVFRFYKYYKDHKFFLSESKKSYEEDNLYEFIVNEKKLKEFIYKKYDYPVEDSVYIFDYSQKLIKELFEFYERKIDEINNNSYEKDDNFINQIHITKRPSIFFKPGDFNELNIYSNYYKEKIQRNKKLKNREEIFNKVFSINEISKQIIYNDNINDYIKRVEFNNIMKYIQEDYYNYHDEGLKLKEAKQPIKYFYYNEVNKIKEENMFGELALNNMNKKRTATIITKEESYFAVLSKKVYDSYLKVAQIKSRIRKMLFFTEGPIFKGLMPGTFLNKYFFRIKKIDCSKGRVLFNRDDFRNKIYFIVKGEFELSCKMTLKEISDTIRKLGGITDNKKEKYLCNLYEEFNKYYVNNKVNIKICVVNKNQVIGLDDMTLDNKYIFDCKCISTDETEIYEFDYNKFEEALKETDLIMANNIKYVNKRRELFIKILFTQRNSLVDLEYKKIKEENKIKKKLTETDLNKKDNILSSLMKKVHYNSKDKEKTINILENYKNRKMKNSKFYNLIRNNSKNTNNSLDESISKNGNTIKIVISSSNNNLINNFKSEKKLSNKQLTLKDKNKTENIFYPKIMSQKNIHAKSNFGIILNKFRTNEEISEEIGKEEDGKNIENKHNDINTKNIKYFSKNKIKLKLKGINNNIKLEDMYEYTENSNYLALSLNNNNIIKSLNINNSQLKELETRRKRNIIPLLTNYKISLNKKSKKLNKKKYNYKIPSLFKEYSKKFTSTKTKISSPDDFYLDYQEEIFSAFNKKYNKNILLTTLQKNYNKNKQKKEIINEYMDNNNKKMENKSINTNINENKNVNKKKKFILNFNVLNKNKNAGIIDCLCLDNWAEKTQFEKQFFG